ncbi:MAG: amidohydrolase family protein, partial [Clostridiales bacterium]|nr:amidohydrolase family protein [Clostridiales bacterium]
MDKIFYNGVITTVDPAYPSVSALCIKGGIIMHLGSDEEMLAYASEGTELVNLEGKFMYPGFIDSHIHLMLDAARDRYLDLTACESYAEFAGLIADEAARVRESGGDWVLGTGFNQDFWSDIKRIPSRLDLDEICSDLPIYLERACGHTAAHNTKALEILGLMEEKEGETKYDMLFLEDGTPQGQLFEGDAGLATAKQPCPDVEEFKQWIKKKTADYAALGLVAIHSDDINIIKAGEDLEPQMQAFEEAAAEGLMSLKVYEQCRFWQPAAIKEFAKKYPRGSTFGTKFETASIKLMADGSLGAHSAVLRDGYLNDPGAEGVLIFSAD